jgi:hypothetical protein
MVAMQGGFDARQVQPDQGMPTHPVGKFPAAITNTSIDANKENTGGYLAVEFTTPAGKIVGRYNLWNTNPQAVEIAQKQLSALCHATGIFQISYANEGRELMNAQLQIEVTKQPKSDYTQVSRVYDVHGNEPGKAPANAPQTAPAQPPQQPAAPPAQGGWGAPPATGPAPAPAAWGGNGAGAPAAPWGGGPAPGAPPAPAAAPPAQQGWQQQPGGAGPAPWGPR